jgi:PhnB protein
MKLIPYLFFNGDCREAITRYRDVLGLCLSDIMAYGETPCDEGGPLPPEWRDKVMHASLEQDDGDVLLMASDGMPDKPLHGERQHVAIGIDDLARARQIFDALAEGGDVKMPFGPTFWAQGYGMLTDRYGTPWMVNCACALEQDALAHAQGTPTQG